jgi:hypothetical protein
LIYDDPGSLHWIGALGQDEKVQDWASGLQRLRPASLYPEGAEAPSLPEWPRPRPVLLFQTPDTTVIVQPLNTPRLAAWASARWKELTAAAVREENNMVRNGDFSEASDFHPTAECWRYFNLVDEERGNTIRIATPPDRPDNPALHFVKQHNGGGNPSIGVYQWLARTADRAGDFVILRFRARAEHGEGRLIVGPRLSLIVPRDDRSPTAERLRAVSTLHPMMPSHDGMECREYRPLNWFQPGASWQTYAIIWDWPEYAMDPSFRNFEISFAGLGEIWVDDVEMFAWSQEVVSKNSKTGQGVVKMLREDRKR